ncbi:MAG: YHS domain-containing protein [Acidimicrobiia bacterium]
MEHEEIAVAVLAELVALKAAGELRSGVEPKAAVDEVIDPVCAMTVDASKARYQTEHEGTVYYFCGAGCQRQFEADPTKFVAAAT